MVSVECWVMTGTPNPPPTGEEAVHIPKILAVAPQTSFGGSRGDEAPPKRGKACFFRMFKHWIYKSFSFISNKIKIKCPPPLGARPRPKRASLPPYAGVSPLGGGFCGGEGSRGPWSYFVLFNVLINEINFRDTIWIKNVQYQIPFIRNLLNLLYFFVIISAPYLRVTINLLGRAFPLGGPAIILYIGSPQGGRARC